jgi:uncharacterized membrane protein YcaP (DUF421 family)
MFDIVLRVGLVYLFLMGVFRLIGKRELSKLSPFELVTLMLIPRAFGNSLTGESSLTTGLLAASALFLFVLGTSALAHVFKPFSKVVNPAPTFLVQDGQVIERELNKERINAEELFGEMHRQGYASLRQVKYAILESGGHISFIPAERTAH